MYLDTIRQAAIDIGYDAYMKSVFVANPHEFNSPAFEAWGDGYFIGVREAKVDLGVKFAANDDGHETKEVDPDQFPVHPWAPMFGDSAVDRFVESV